VAKCWATVNSWLQAKDNRPSVKVPSSKVQQLVTVDPIPASNFSNVSGLGYFVRAILGIASIAPCGMCF
jgi:hypothetical protein